MLGLTPAKLMILFVVIVVVLGPNRLPEVARQLGRSWQRLRDLRQRVDQEVHRSVPNLPSSDELVRIARSPMTLLNELASLPSVDPAAAGHDTLRPDPAAPDPPAPSDLGARGPAASPGGGAGTGAVTGAGAGAGRAFPLQPSDDPGMN